MKLFAISVLLSLIILVGCVPSPHLQFDVIENYPQLFIDDTEFCCEFRNTTLDEQGNFVLIPNQYVELYIDLDKDLFTIVEYNNETVRQYDYEFVVFDYEPIMNSSNELIIVRTGLLTDLGNSDNKLLFRYSLHENGSYVVFELSTMDALVQYLFIPINLLNGNM